MLEEVGLYEATLYLRRFTDYYAYPLIRVVIPIETVVLCWTLEYSKFHFQTDSRICNYSHSVQFEVERAVHLPSRP